MKKLVLWTILIVIGLSVVGFVVRNCTRAAEEAAEVAHQEFGAKELLRKYEWFKDASAQLDKKVADVEVYNQRTKMLEADYKGTPRQKWAREDREQYNIWSSELAGVKASYNLLAADYNSQMAKVNWRFTNAGDLPKGADKPLPREYKPYITE